MGAVRGGGGGLVVGSGRPSSGGCFPGPGGEEFDRRKRGFAVSGLVSIFPLFIFLFFSLDEEGGGSRAD
jgi:hypothetical protein